MTIHRCTSPARVSHITHSRPLRSRVHLDGERAFPGAVAYPGLISQICPADPRPTLHPAYVCVFPFVASDGHLPEGVRTYYWKKPLVARK